METALVLPILLLIVFGIIDFGRMLNAQITVTEAAREAARAASLGYSPATVASGLNPTPTIDTTGCGGGGVDATATVTYQFEFVTPVAVMADLATGPITLTGRGVMPCRS